MAFLLAGGAAAAEPPGLILTAAEVRHRRAWIEARARAARGLFELFLQSRRRRDE